MTTFFPGLTSLKETSAAVFAAAMTSAALPVTGPSWRAWVWATTAMNPSIWQPMSLYEEERIWCNKSPKSPIQQTWPIKFKENLHLHNITFLQHGLITSKWGIVTDSVVNWNTSRKSYSSFNLSLDIFVHIGCLPAMHNLSVPRHQIHQHKRKAIHMPSSEHWNCRQQTLRLYELWTHSRIKESPFSHISTILAFGLHSETANCRASAKRFTFCDQWLVQTDRKYNTIKFCSNEDRLTETRENDRN